MKKELRDVLLGKDFLDYISHNGEGYLGTKERVKWWKKYYDLFKNHYRYRMNNDYKNTDVIVKWQDDKWTAKFAWKEIDRHLPTGLFSTSITDSQFVDTDILDWYMSKRKQTLTSKEALNSLQIDGIALSTNVARLYQNLNLPGVLKETEMQGFVTDDSGTVTAILMKLIIEKEDPDNPGEEMEARHFYYYDLAEDTLTPLSKYGYELP